MMKTMTKNPAARGPDKRETLPPSTSLKFRLEAEKKSWILVPSQGYGTRFFTIWHKLSLVPGVGERFTSLKMLGYF